MLTYGIGFITVMFMGFLCGFMIGKHLLKWNFQNSLIMSLVMGTFTLFSEAILLLIRLHKMEQAKIKHEKIDKFGRGDHERKLIDTIFKMARRNQTAPFSD